MCVMELWDVYDKDRNLTGRLHERGQPLPPGDFHLVVDIWIKNSAGEYLIQRRALTKPLLPGKWGCAAAGAAQTGDDSLAAVLRETKEELGLDLEPDSLRLLTTFAYDSWFVDVWYTELDVDAGALTLQEEEVMAAKWATVNEIRALVAGGEFFWRDALERIPELPAL